VSKEKELFKKAKAVFEELLDDFNARGLLRKRIPHDQRERLAKMFSQSRQIGQALNAITKIFDSNNHVRSFADRNRADGINEEILTGVFLNQATGNFIYNIETLFKTALIFFLQEKQGLFKRMEVGRLIHAIKDISPSIGAKLEPLIDLELRNALAHGAFWFETGGQAYLSPDSHLESPKNIKFVEFMIRVKKQNITAHAFVEVLVERVRQGYFKG
jgi:hypothetical protein